MGEGSESLILLVEVRELCVSQVCVCRDCRLTPVVTDGDVCVGLRVDILGRERGSKTFLSPRAGWSSKSEATTNPWMGDGYMGGDQGSCIVIMCVGADEGCGRCVCVNGGGRKSIAACVCVCGQGSRGATWYRVFTSILEFCRSDFVTNFFLLP